MPIFLPGKFHGQRSLAGYSPWGHKQLDMTEWLSTHTRIEIDMFAHSLPCDFAVPQLGWVKYVSDPSDAMLGHAYAEQLTECSMTDDRYDNGLLWQNCPGDDKAWITEFAVSRFWAQWNPNQFSCTHISVKKCGQGLGKKAASQAQMFLSERVAKAKRPCRWRERCWPRKNWGWVIVASRKTEGEYCQDGGWEWFGPLQSADVKEYFAHR